MLAVRPLGQLALIEKGLVAHRIPAGIFGEIDVPICLHAPPDLLARGVVAGLRGAHDVVGSRVEHIAHALELGGGAVGELLGRDAVPRRRLLHLLPMLVHARDEEHLAPVQPHEALDGVGGDALIGVADMRRAIGVGDGGGDVETAAGHGISRVRSGCAVRGAWPFGSCQDRAARTAAARSAKIDRTSGRLSRFSASASRTASATFSPTSA